MSFDMNENFAFICQPVGDQGVSGNKNNIHHPRDSQLNAHLRVSRKRGISCTPASLTLGTLDHSRAL
jgi:hypothetical protein